MDGLNIADNIVRLRHEKKITQERLAEFIGVTKASVSKWETGQSMPDILILPRLAAFFDITVDELIGYVPQLSKEQIQKWYQEFAGKFAEGPFEEVMAETQDYVKKYYSCYPFLYQVCILWLNHFMLAEGKERQLQILVAITELCGHIKENCRELRISDDVIVLQAMVHLQLGQPGEVVDALEEMSRPDRLLGQSGVVLVQAYKMAGEDDKAESFMQISMYNALVSLVGTAAEYISVHMDNLKDCEATIERIGKVGEIYHLGKLNPNLIAAFEYRAAVCYGSHRQKEKTLAHIKRYVQCVEELFSADILLLHGDAYFNKIEEWFGQAQGGTGAPRNRQLVLEEVKYSLDSPLFAFLEGETGFGILKKKLKEIK